MKKYLLIFFLLFNSQFVSSMSILKERLKTQNYLKSRQKIINSTPKSHENVSFNHKEIALFNDKVKSYLPKKIRDSISYWLFIKKDKISAMKCYEYFLLYKLTVLRDYLENPFTLEKNRALAILRQITKTDDINSKNVFKKMKEKIKNFSRLTFATNKKNIATSIVGNAIILNKFTKSFKEIDNYSLNSIGYLSDNKATFKKITNKTEFKQSVLTLLKKSKKNIVLSDNIYKLFFSDIDFKNILKKKKKKDFKIIIITPDFINKKNVEYLYLKNKETRLVFIASDVYSNTPSTILYSAFLKNTKNQNINYALITGQVAQLIFNKIKLLIKINTKNFVFSYDDNDMNINYSENGADILRFEEYISLPANYHSNKYLISMIINAKKTIYIEKEYLYDPSLIKSLLKKKVKDPAIDIKIIISKNVNNSHNGFPNTTFLKELKKYGIIVKSIMHDELRSSNSSIDGRILLQEFKVTPYTFRKSQFPDFILQSFNIHQTKNFDIAFIKRWNNNSITQLMDIDNFKMKIDGKSKSIKESSLLNNIGRQLLQIN